MPPRSLGQRFILRPSTVKQPSSIASVFAGRVMALLAEEIDPSPGRMLDNFPRAYSHVGFINPEA
jgi:hypothetical protein